MPLINPNSTVPTNVSFNSGVFIINNIQMAVLQDVTVSLDWTSKEIRQLGSLLMAVAPKRASFKPTAKAKVMSVNPALYTYFMGSSNTDGTGLDYTVLDGQNVLTNCAIQCIINENSGQIVQWQFTNAILTGALSIGLKMESAAESDFEIIAQNVTVVTNFVTS